MKFETRWIYAIFIDIIYWPENFFRIIAFIVIEETNALPIVSSCIGNSHITTGHCRPAALYDQR